MRRHLLVASITLAGPPLCVAYIACSGEAAVVPSDEATRPDAGRLEDGGLEDLDGNLVLPLFEDVEAGGLCEASVDCPPGLVCWYPVAQGCAATGVCIVLAASKCGGPYCTCRGDTTAVCGDFGQLPMRAPLRGPPCGAGSDDGGGAEMDADDAND
jgi:hypothetical protein